MELPEIKKQLDKALPIPVEYTILTGTKRIDSATGEETEESYLVYKIFPKEL